MKRIVFGFNSWPECEEDFPITEVRPDESEKDAINRAKAYYYPELECYIKEEKMKPMKAQYHTIKVYHIDGRMEVYEHWEGGSKVYVLPSDVPEEFKNAALVALVLGLEGLNLINERLDELLKLTPYYLNNLYNINPGSSITLMNKNKYLTLQITPRKEP